MSGFQRWRLTALLAAVALIFGMVLPALGQTEDPTVEVFATETLAHEEGASAGEFTLIRSGDVPAALAVDYSVSGSATAGDDYAVLSGSVSFAAGAATAVVTVTPVWMIRWWSLMRWWS